MKEKERHNQNQVAAKKRWRMLIAILSGICVLALVVMIWLYATAAKGKEDAEAQLRIATENIRTSEEKIKEALRSDSIAQLEKLRVDTALQVALQRIAQLEAEKAERDRIEVEKYLASARRMMRVGDREMAHQILLEAQKLDRVNPEISALLKEIE